MITNDVVNRINDVLQAGEPANVTEMKASGGRTYRNYRIHHVIFAINDVVGAENWAYTSTPVQIKQGSKNEEYIVKVDLLLPNKGGEMQVRASAYGSGSDAGGDDGDGMNAGVSNALKKCFWSLGIAKRAYLDQLPSPTDQFAAKRAYQAPQAPPSQSAPPPQQQSAPVGFITDAQKQAVLQLLQDPARGFNLADQAAFAQQLADAMACAGFGRNTNMAQLPERVQDGRDIVAYLEPHLRVAQPKPQAPPPSGPPQQSEQPPAQSPLAADGSVKDPWE